MKSEINEIFKHNKLPEIKLFYISLYYKSKAFAIIHIFKIFFQ